jgi:hypothetical protein
MPVIIPDGDGVLTWFSAFLRSIAGQDRINRDTGHPPPGLDVQRLLAVIADLHHSAAQSEDAQYEIERENATALALIPSDSWLTTGQAAEQLGVSVRTMQQRAKEYGGSLQRGRWWFHPEVIRGARQRRLLYRGTP